MLPSGRKFDGRSAAKSRWVMVLRACGNVDDDGLSVAADVNPIDFALPCSGEAVEGGANGHGHSTGTTDAGTRGGFGVGHKREAALRAEEFGDFRKERQAKALGFPERGERGKAFFALNIARREANGLAAIRVGFNVAGSVKRDGGIDGNGAGMKQVEGPDVERAAGKVHTGWSLGFDDHE